MSKIEAKRPKPKQQKLYEHVQAFVRDQKIGCSETIHQSDRVIENAYEFIDGCCQIVGFYEDDEV